MRSPRNPAQNGVSVKFNRSNNGPRTPSANRLAAPSSAAVAVGARVTKTAKEAAPFSQSTRAWRSGGDRKIMFENRAGQALIPEVTRPVFEVAILTVSAWLLLATGTFQVVVSKLSDFVWPLHWVGVLLMFLGLVTMGVRIYANRCGTAPQCVVGFGMASLAACLTAWLACDGPLYDEVKSAEVCSASVTGSLCPDSDCVCDTGDLTWDLCVDFSGECRHVTGNRRYLMMSTISLWAGMGLSVIVSVAAAKIIADTLKSDDAPESEAKTTTKEKGVVPETEPQAAPAVGV